MRILIVNDDGVLAPGILHLAKWARKYGEVTVAAPKTEQSGKSHAIDFIEPFEVKRVDFFEDIEAYSVDSTPADCTRFGIVGLGREYDLVLSGINYGVNMSGDIVYSGTVGAIFEAEHLGHRAIALSIAKGEPLPPHPVLDSLLEYVLNNRLFDYSMLYNVNIPTAPRGIKITRQGSAYFKDEFYKLDGDMYMQRGYPIAEKDADNEIYDTVAFLHGYVSVTPMTIERTKVQAFEELKEILR